MNAMTQAAGQISGSEQHTDRTSAVTVVYIVSCPFSGSTWLNLMLASHSRAFGIGEMDKFDRDFGKVLCNVHGAECPFWTRFDPASPEDRYAQVARLSGRDFIINNNKAIETVGDHTDPQIRGKYIFLLRDGRAVTASRLRKKPGETIRQGARWWKKVFHEKYDRFRSFPAADRLDVHYEALMDDTAGQMRRICDFLGIEYEPGMLEYWNFDHHLIAGNLGTQLAMVRKTGGDLPSESIEQSKTRVYKWDVSYYKTADAAQFKDERWKSEFSAWKRLVFGWHAGRLNRRLGYGRHGLRPGACIRV
jgi:hypothetical protein